MEIFCQDLDAFNLMALPIFLAASMLTQFYDSFVYG